MQHNTKIRNHTPRMRFEHYMPVLTTVIATICSSSGSSNSIVAVVVVVVVVSAAAVVAVTNFIQSINDYITEKYF